MELSPETLKTILNEGIELLYQVIPSLIYAIIFYLVGRFVVNKLLVGLQLILEKRDTNLSLSTFLLGLVKALLFVSLFIGVATIVGVPMSSFFAILGAAGLAIGLALQGSLSNFAGGVLILLFKPFQVGDVIIGMGHKGTVQRIDILYTHLFTFDNKEVVIPNGNLANADVINITSQPTRRVDMNVGVAYSSDLKKVRKVVLAILAKDSRVHSDPEPVVVLTNFGDSSLDLVIRAWTDTDCYWEVYHETLEKIKEAFEKEQIEIPFPQRVVYHIKEEGI
ncbi:MAG: mechanosensitive ion channel family protein [Algoriphagus sp.]|jgi:small conductance mechanosensitive channel|uniref:mechanosensitive ion channel family protein n=1 Tax=Algoriphagus sp. TaxID=1872435 RepID=UPI0027704DBC|nr:mechanosensitive ion channel family protein [Algoriphagus sp.]MDP4903486.1 mechanosensitive ion channel family protein [Algoriphagus sp.]MDP5125727.1 mechanosensitive ion channel family protein [Algoriphagus sp.]